MAAVAHSLLAVLAVALAWASMRRADRAEADAAEQRETVAIVLGARRRDRVELDGLARRATQIERDVATLTRYQHDTEGEVSPEGYLLIVAAGRLTTAVREAQEVHDGSVRR